MDTNFAYLECGLPSDLQAALDQFKIGEQKHNEGNYLHFDCDWMELNACINSSEVEQEISERQAWYLREKYLGMQRE